MSLTVTGGDGAEPDLVGQVLAGRYRVLAKLGEGAMGAVYLAEHLKMGRRDAIKVLRPALAGDAEAIARFTRGTRNVSAIQHPNVCTIYDFSDTPDGIRFLAMEYIEGETLKEVLDREGRIEAGRAVEIAVQTAHALQAAHDAGVVHRDLKPGNIMLCRRGGGRELVKVVDFDIAKGPADPEGEEVTRVGFVVGTPEYMSPEQLIGERLDGRSDVYSLGTVLFRMLAGELPFRAESTQELMLQRLTGTPMRLDDVVPDAPPRLQPALDRALALKPENRQLSATQFAEEITAAMTGAAPTTPVAPPPEPVAPATTTPVESEELTPTRVAVVAAPAPRRLLVPAAIAGAAILAMVAFLARPQTEAPPETQAEPEVARTQDEVSAPVTPDTLTESLPPVTVPPRPEPGETRVPTPEPEASFVFPGGLSAMLDRHLDVLYGQPSAATLGAVRDSAELAWRAARTRADSTTAALVLAQAAYRAGDDAACARWAQRGADLGGVGFAPLLDACR